MRCRRTCARLLGPDGGEMAFAGAFGSYQQHDPVWPFGPAINQRQATGIGRSLEKIVAGKALRVRQRKCKLTRLNASCQTLTPCWTNGRLIILLQSCSCAAPNP